MLIDRYTFRLWSWGYHQPAEHMGLQTERGAGGRGEWEWERQPQVSLNTVLVFSTKHRRQALHCTMTVRCLKTQPFLWMLELGQTLDFSSIGPQRPLPPLQVVTAPLFLNRVLFFTDKQAYTFGYLVLNYGQILSHSPSLGQLVPPPPSLPHAQGGDRSIALSLCRVSSFPHRTPLGSMRPSHHDLLFRQ